MSQFESENDSQQYGEQSAQDEQSQGGAYGEQQADYANADDQTNEQATPAFGAEQQSAQGAPSAPSAQGQQYGEQSAQDEQSQGGAYGEQQADYANADDQTNEQATPAFGAGEQDAPGAQGESEQQQF